MTRVLFLLVLQLISCNGSYDATPKNYTTKHIEAFAFCKQQKYCEDFYFLIDLSLHSGKNRFYVYDFKTKKIVAQNLVTHGSCDAFEINDTKYEKVKFSNQDDSHCSSMGKYKVGKRDRSSWGVKIKYWLEGLEASNSNAQNRVVVLHSWDAIANTEIYPKYSPLSWGCPAVSGNFMHTLDTKLQATKKPVLLWIID